MLIEDLLLAVPTLAPEAESIESDGRWWSWGEVAGVMRRMREACEAAGAPEGARIGLLLRNRAPQVAALVGCICAHRCAVAFNPVLPAGKVAEDVRAQAPAMLAGEEADLSSRELAEVCAALAIPRLALPAVPDGAAHWIGDPQRVSPERLERLAPETMFEMLSSGTTGPPKRIPLERRKFNESFKASLAYEKDRGEAGPALRSGVRLQTAPPTHISGLFGAVTTLAEGRKLVLLERFTVETWTAAVERTRPRVCNLPPTALRMILDAETPKARLESLAALRSGTAPLDPAIIDAFQERYGIPVLPQYGATEFAGAVAGWDIKAFRELYAAKRGSVGRLQPQLDGRIVDPQSGEELPPGQVGVLELRGPHVADGQSWVRTTDLCSLDADRYLWIHGRADSAINRGGFKVHPEEIVRALAAHPAVADASVVGVPDRRLGEAPAAAVAVRPGHPAPSAEQLKAHLAERLLPYQIPAHFLLLDDLPRTPSMKPSLPEVRRLFAEALAGSERPA